MLELSIELTVRLCVNLMGRNTSLIDYCQSNGKHKYIQIDFTLHNIPQADSVSCDEVLFCFTTFCMFDYLRNLWKFSLNFLDIEAAMITCFSENSLAAKFPFILIIHGTSKRIPQHSFMFPAGLLTLKTVETTKRLEHEKGSFSWNDSRV
ncbi:hypothetical protein Bca4012_097694 [Brassica carinata]